MKKCSACLQRKTRSAFGKNALAADGKCAACKSCRRLRSSRYYQSNKADINDRTKAFKRKHPELARLYHRKWKLRTAYGLTIEDVELAKRQQKGNLLDSRLFSTCDDGRPLPSCLSGMVSYLREAA